MSEEEPPRPRASIFNPYRDIPDDKVDEQMRMDFADVFGTPKGALVLSVIMDRASMFNSTLSLNRVERDMTDGKRELAMQIFELAGFATQALPGAMIHDNLLKANSKEAGRHGRRADNATQPRWEPPIADPGQVFDDGDE